MKLRKHEWSIDPLGREKIWNAILTKKEKILEGKIFEHTFIEVVLTNNKRTIHYIIPEEIPEDGAECVKLHLNNKLSVPAPGTFKIFFRNCNEGDDIILVTGYKFQSKPKKRQNRDYTLGN
jgi:hypothetical protein